MKDFNEIRETLEKKFGIADQAEIVWLAENIITLDEEKAISLIKLLETLDNCEDVQNVFGNFDIDENLYEKLNS